MVHCSISGHLGQHVLHAVCFLLFTCGFSVRSVARSDTSPAPTVYHSRGAARYRQAPPVSSVWHAAGRGMSTAWPDSVNTDTLSSPSHYVPRVLSWYVPFPTRWHVHPHYGYGPPTNLSLWWWWPFWCELCTFSLFDNCTDLSFKLRYSHKPIPSCPTSINGSDVSSLVAVLPV